MNKPIYRFEFVTPGGGDRWSRQFAVGSDEVAKTEGRLLLEDQALLRPSTEMRVIVSRDAGGRLHPIGTWTWAQMGASWQPAGDATA